MVSLPHSCWARFPLATLIIYELSKAERPTKHIIGHVGGGFMGQKTHPTVSKHWKKRSPKDQGSISLGPPHCADNNTTYMQYEKNKIHTDKHN